MSITDLRCDRRSISRGIGLAGIVVLSCAALVPACQQSRVRRDKATERPKFALQTGKEVAVTGVGLERAPSRALTMYVDYVTELPVRDYLAVAPEVVEVWAEFRGLAEAKAARTMMVRATNKAAPTESVVFGFIHDSGGGWQTPEVRTLPSGQKILVVRVTQDGAQLFIDYVTGHQIRDVCALGPEVDDVWAAFRDFAEQSEATSVFVSPSGAPVGGGSISFSITRDGDGSWSRQELCRQSRS